ncbi:MAG TPA: hypothetical protein PKE26_09290 [Kiritimatiellia bacterium]|nr:hypothetical protein [Kiritimatiellia bacterium]HMO99288.1 hypothetical protein [Kiritimatiellia bacterium]HMP95620.1 hypothetical protein [Kiritimatiellia bacterium]
MTHSRALRILVAAIAVFLVFLIFAGMRSRDEARRRACESTLRDLEGAKEQYALEHDGVAPPVLDSLVPRYLPEIPRCPAGGRYTLGDLQTPASCSLPDHTVAWDE